MAERTITDDDGRTWTVRNLETPRSVGQVPRQGRDVTLTCTTPSIPSVIRLIVGWQWEKMAPRGLARMIAAAIPR